MGVGVGWTGVGVGSTQASMLSSYVRVQPRDPVGSSHAVMATVAVWSSVGGVTAKVLTNDAANENGEPATAVPSIETATLFGFRALYWVRSTVRPASQVSETLGVCAEATVGATRAAPISAKTASHEARRARRERAPERDGMYGFPEVRQRPLDE
jgi:hypothetical protein